MQCTVTDCPHPTVMSEPVPLCNSDALRVMVAYAQTHLANVEDQFDTTISDEIGALYELLDAEGWNAIGLKRAKEELGHRSQATVARRLALARKRYAAELSRRTEGAAGD